MKKTYIAPAIDLIILDNEISLVLVTDVPPIGPNEARNNYAPDYFNNGNMA